MIIRFKREHRKLVNKFVLVYWKPIFKYWYGTLYNLVQTFIDIKTIHKDSIIADLKVKMRMHNNKITTFSGALVNAIVYP